jgi:hypothetical protein
VPVPVAAGSKALVLAAGIMGLWVRIPLEGWTFTFNCVCFCVVLFCIGRGLCDGLITPPKESY